MKENGLTSIEEVTDYVKAGGGCGNCHDKIQFIIDDMLGNAPRAAKKPEILTNIQKIKMIDATLEREIKPALNQDGGDIELVDVDGDRVLVKLRGTCASCSKSQITLKHYVETKLKDLVSQNLVVEEV